MSKTKKQDYPKSLIVHRVNEAGESWYNAYTEAGLQDDLVNGDEVAVYTYSGTLKVKKTVTLE